MAAAAYCSSKSNACAEKAVHGRWIYCYDARATAFWIEKIRKNKEAKTMAIEFGSRKETFENYKVYETMLAGRPF